MEFITRFEEAREYVDSFVDVLSLDIPIDTSVDEFIMAGYEEVEDHWVRPDGFTTVRPQPRLGRHSVYVEGVVNGMQVKACIYRDARRLITVSDPPSGLKFDVHIRHRNEVHMIDIGSSRNGLTTEIRNGEVRTRADYVDSDDTTLRCWKVYQNGELTTVKYTKNGRYHLLEGAAVTVYKEGKIRCEYWINGVRMSKKHWDVESARIIREYRSRPRGSSEDLF